MTVGHSTGHPMHLEAQMQTGRSTPHMPLAIARAMARVVGAAREALAAIRSADDYLESRPPMTWGRWSW
jgi:hypothetical protein